jgi:hypothetical protein
VQAVNSFLFLVTRLPGTVSVLGLGTARESLRAVPVLGPRTARNSPGAVLVLGPETARVSPGIVLLTGPGTARDNPWPIPVLRIETRRRKH